MRRTKIRRVATILALEALEVRQLLAVHFTVDLNQNRASISPFIYGVNQPLTGANSNDTLTRLGGNRWTAYNWEDNASNAGSDYLFQNDDFLGGGSTPGGAVAPTLADAAAHNAAALITVPMAGYVAADTNGGGDVHNSGPDYLQTRFKQLVAKKNAPFSLTPDTTDNYVYADEFVNWVKQNYGYGETDPAKPIFFSLDNEPDLWSGTHAEIHPTPVTYAELVQKSIDFASAIKAVEPGSKIFGPVNYGYNGYVNLQNATDANGQDFQSYYLQQMKTASDAAGQRLLDVLDVHWYTEAQTPGGVQVGGSQSTPDVVAARVQAPRSLWDPTYTENSWITQTQTNGPIQLIPTLDNKIAQNYPGTKLAITEYNYGGGADISGAIAQADTLGIFGREGVFAAAEWPLTANESFIQGGFAAFRNYDGHNGTFGDTSIKATTDDNASSSIYASVDSANPDIMTLVAINKTGQPLATVLNLGSIGHNVTASAYQITSAGPTPHAAGTFGIADPANFGYTLPAFSVTTLRIDLSTGQAVLPPPDPSLSAGDVSIVEGNSGTKTAVFTVRLTPSGSAAATKPVTVQYATATGTARAGSDYKRASGTLTFLPGQTKKTVPVTIYGDTTPEPNETFKLKLSNPTHALLSIDTATGTIVNDDRFPVTAKFRKDGQWATGYTGYIKVTNTGKGPLTPWTVEFDLAASIDGMWNAAIISHTGNHYVVGAVDYTTTIAPKGFVDFGFNTTGPVGNLPSHIRFDSVLV